MSAHLLTPAVKSHFHLPPGLGVVTPLHQREVMRIFQRHLVAALGRPLQAVEVAVGEAACTRRAGENGVYAAKGRWRDQLTQFLLRKHQKRGVLVQVLVELYGELTDELGSSFDFLERQKEIKNQKK